MSDFGPLGDIGWPLNDLCLNSRANWKHGFYSAKAIAERREARALARAMRQSIAFDAGIGR
jgi:hypothetical protein